MRYIRRDADGIYHFDAYLAYLATIAPRLPPGAATFVRTVDHARLDGPAALHDAWLDSLRIRKRPDASDALHRALAIELRLLAAAHDRWIVLVYDEVAGYHLTAPTEYAIPFATRAAGRPPFTVSQRDGHSDLLVHELRLTDHGTIEHEFQFALGTSWTIESADVQFHQEVITPG